jgi:hypothetical protein
LAFVVDNTESNDVADANNTEREKAIEFLKKRGFKLKQLDEGFEIRITHRSVGAGINEIFVELDELGAVKNLGNLAKIVYSEEVLILVTRRNEM